MAKTIMISNDVYEELKRIKGDKSFSEVIRESVVSRSRKARNGSEFVKMCAGLLAPGDNEYENVLKESRKGWQMWEDRMKKELE